MIDWYQAFLLAIMQGLTEFLPISSSAHLVIPSLVFDWPDQGLAFDVAVHVGTLLAVVFYYRHDLLRMADSWLRSLVGGPVTEDSRLVWYLAVATIPVGVVGYGGGGFIEGELRALPVIATTTLVFGLLLGVADRYASSNGGGLGKTLTLPVAIMIGLAQGLAPVPGVSRSGITMTAALLLDMDRQSAARFSFLLSIPVIASAGTLKAWELSHAATSVNWSMLALAVLVSAVTAYLCIALFLRLLNRVGLMPFVYYRIVLALFLYGLYYL